MLYNDFTFTIAQRQGSGYPVSALAEGIGRVSATLPAPDSILKGLVAQVAGLPPHANRKALLRLAGEALFRWLTRGEFETHLRIAWDRADRLSRGLRLRLSIDAPEIGAWPWELLYDPTRDHCFATSISTLLVRYLDQASHFGALADLETRLPMNLILLLPTIPDLDLRYERTVIEQATSQLSGAVNLCVLEGQVTRTTLSETLLAGHYDIAHFSGHGDFSNGQGYLSLNGMDGKLDWVDGQTLSSLLANHRSLKLVMLNACSTGCVDAGQAFQGLAPQLVRHGVPAAIAMQYPLTDRAAITFARGFYQQLCMGENAGQVDVAVTHARNMLAILYPGDRSWAAPVLYTHAADGIIYTLPRESAAQVALDPSSQRARTAMLIGSLQASMDFDEDWALAEPAKLIEWRRILKRAEQAYWLHLADPQVEVQQAARYGLAVVHARLAALDQAMATADQ